MIVTEGYAGHRPAMAGTYVGTYKGVKLYTRGGCIEFLLGWVPQSKSSLRAAKCAITKWRNV